MSAESSARGDGDDAEVAARRFRVEVVPASRSRRLVTFLPSMTGALFGEMAPRWPPHTTRVVDVRTGKCVFEPEGLGDTSDYAEVLRADLDRMSVEEFCEQWGIDRESVGLPPRAAPAVAAPPKPLTDEDLASLATERLFRFVGDAVVGMVVGLVRGDQELIVSRGPVSPDGVFDVGSITKLFTALLLADMASRGEVGLDDPVEQFLPAGVRAPKWRGKGITLLDLATHTSGLPRLPRNLLLRATLHGSDPYRGYAVEDLQRGLAAVRLRRAPGSAYRYSNFGFAVLGHALASAAGASYEELVVDRVCRKLGLGETMFEVSADVGRRRETGHAGRRRPVRDWDLAAFAPAGGLRSTVGDMVRFLQANVDPARTEMPAALADAQRPRRPIGANEEIGLAWHLRRDDGTTVAWHNGGTGGFGGFVATARRPGTGVAVLYNSAPSSAVDAAAFGLLSDLGWMTSAREGRPRPVRPPGRRPRSAGPRR